MIGYLIFDRNIIQESAADKAVNRLAASDLMKKVKAGDTCVYLFQNRNSNNYIFEDEKALLCASGTYIFDGFKGNEALKKLSEDIGLGKTITDSYLEFLGCYNLIYINKSDSSLHIYTDKEGLHNGYISKENEMRAFSSSQLLLSSLIDTNLDEIAIWEFVHIGACMDWKTIFKNIKKMDAATEYYKRDGAWKQKRLWRISVKQPYLPDSDKEIINKTSSMFINNLKVISNIEGNRVGTDLTGGTDTRTMLAFLYNLDKDLVISTAGPPNHKDVIISKRIAEKLGLKHYWYNDSDPMEITPEEINRATEVGDGILNVFHLAKAIPYFKEKSKKFDILLGGNGGPLFKDHYWLFEFNRINKLREPNWRRIANLSITDYPIQDNLFSIEKEGICSHLEKMFHRHSKNINATNNQKLDYVYFDFKCAAFHAPQFTIQNQFLDVYHPMMNGGIVEYMGNIKPDIRKRNILQFSMVYNNSKKLAWIRTDNECPAVPSTGKFFFLRAYVFWRYFRAFLRKFYIQVLKKSFVKPVHSLKPIVDQLKKHGYWEMLKHDELKIAPLFSQKELLRIIENPYESSNLTYLMNILSVELSIRHAEKLGDKTIVL